MTLRLPSDRKNGIKRDLGLFAQDRWSMGRITLNLGLRYDQFIGEIARELDPRRTASRPATTFGECADGTVDPGDLCTGEVQNWKDISPRVGFAMDVFGNGRTALKASFARYVAGQAIAVANQVNPIGALTAHGYAPLDRPRRQRPAVRRQRQHPAERADELDIDADVRPSHRADDAVRAGRAERLGQARLQHRVHDCDAASARGSHLGQRRLLPSLVRQPDLHRRPALRREQLRLVLHHGAGRPGSARTAAATRCAACRTSSRRCSRRTCRPTT